MDEMDGVGEPDETDEAGEPTLRELSMTKDNSHFAPAETTDLRSRSMLSVLPSFSKCEFAKMLLPEVLSGYVSLLAAH